MSSSLTASSRICPAVRPALGAHEYRPPRELPGGAEERDRGARLRLPLLRGGAHLDGLRAYRQHDCVARAHSPWLPGTAFRL